jgi:hypothetical protein
MIEFPKTGKRTPNRKTNSLKTFVMSKLFIILTKYSFLLYKNRSVDVCPVLLWFAEIFFSEQKVLRNPAQDREKNRILKHRTMKTIITKKDVGN